MMSLKYFHIFFIALSILTTLGFGFWAWRDYAASGDLVTAGFGALSFAAGGGLIYYLLWFVQKSKKLTGV